MRLYTTLPHNLIRNQLVGLIENTFRCEEALYLVVTKTRNRMERNGMERNNSHIYFLKHGTLGMERSTMERNILHVYGTT